MAEKEISLFLLLGHLLIAGVGSTCVYEYCLRCNYTGSERCSDSYFNITNITDCKKVFEVSINASNDKPQEGDTLILKCIHELPSLNLTYNWTKNGKKLKGGNNSTFTHKRVFSKDKGMYICHVNSLCGNYQSSSHEVTVVNNSLIILVVCGIAALVLVLVLGLAMKFKLKRDNAKHRERMEHRRREGVNIPAPRES